MRSSYRREETFIVRSIQNINKDTQVEDTLNDIYSFKSRTLHLRKDPWQNENEEEPE